MIGPDQDRQVPSALTYLAVLIRWRGLITRMVLFSVIMMAIYSLIIPKTFKSEAVIIPASEEARANILDAISGGLFGYSIGGGSPEILLLKAILESRTLKENIALQFNLREIYEAENMDEVVLGLTNHITVTITADNTLEVAFDHNTEWFSIINKEAEELTRRFVQKVAAGIIEQLDLLNRRNQGQEARNYRQFIEERYAAIENDLAVLEDSLSRFQRKHGVTIVDAQLRATFEAAAALEAEVIKRELAYAMAEARLGPNSQMLKNLHTELQGAKAAFENSFGGRDDEKRYLIGYDRDLPGMLQEYLRLQRGVRIQSEVFVFITTRYEESKLREARNIPTINILDYPDVPDIRTAPRRSFLVITTGILMTVFAIIFAFILDFFRQARDQYPEQYRILTQPKKRGTSSLERSG